MNTKKSMVIWVFIGIFIIFLLLFLTTNSAQAQLTMKFKIFNNVVKFEFMPFPDEKGHGVGIMSREGLALFENGEVGNQSAVLALDMKENTVKLDVVTTIVLRDGSSFVFRTKGTGEKSPDGKLWFTKQTGDFLRGTGKYEGIKGTINIVGTQYGMAEAGKGHWIADVTASYTLPSK
jgi:hypothetical protein